MINNKNSGEPRVEFSQRPSERSRDPHVGKVLKRLQTQGFSDHLLLKFPQSNIVKNQPVRLYLINLFLEVKICS